MYKASNKKSKEAENTRNKSDVDAESNVNNNDLHVLSWGDARKSLLQVLLDWEYEQNKQKKNPTKNYEEFEVEDNTKRKIFKNCYLDMILSIILSISLLVLSLFPFHFNLDTIWDICNVAAGVIAVSCSIFSLIMSIQRKIVASKSQNSGLRNCVRSFATFLSHLSLQRNKSLRKRFFATFDNTNSMESKNSEHFESNNSKNEGGSDGNSNSGEFRITSEMGTSLTDIYPVYRLSRAQSGTYDVKCSKEIKPDWHRVPSLLLVNGDIIALQVGDVVPATVDLLDPSLNVTLMKGERVTLESLSSVSKRSFREKKKYPFSLPPGKLQFQPESRQLLDLCNSMRIFILRETPLVEFLKQETSKHRAPQIHRQIYAIRLALFIASLTVFMLTCIILLSRGAISFETYSSHSSSILTLPLISALSLLPFVSPVVLYFLEIWGTCRIMTNIYRFTNNNDVISSYSINGKSGIYNFSRYFLSALQSRFTTQNYHHKNKSFFCSSSNSVNFSVPPTNSYLLEKLGVVTALALVDDELVCEPFSKPQQLLIPSARGGFKLLDLCPNMPQSSVEDEEESKDHNSTTIHRRVRGPYVDSDSDSDAAIDVDQQMSFTHSFTERSISFDFRRALHGLKRYYYTSNKSQTRRGYSEFSGGLSRFLQHLEYKEENLSSLSVQFEDPSWWKFLPSLKCIGLACLLVNGKENKEEQKTQDTNALSSALDKFEKSGVKGTSSTGYQPIKTTSFSPSKLPPLPNLFDPSNETSPQSVKTDAEASLLPFICPSDVNVQNTNKKQQHQHLKLLAQCIGFTASDLAVFKECKRVHIISIPLLHKRLSIDTHALGLTESREWGFLRPDATSVVLQDRRSKSYQLLTIGNASVVLSLCVDSWQGEHSTIVPLSNADRSTIIDTCNNWALADLDVAAFSYAPVPCTLEQRITSNNSSTTYLVDNRSSREQQQQQHHYHRHTYNVSATSTGAATAAAASDWNLVANQIFLGVLGSSVSPRKIISTIIDQLTSAGVRFVYFSPRNMRRTKELASQMGIDVAWNCAISLRPLDEGQDDPHRMVSSYADWDVNAKLPHGVENVKEHLEKVDNVPLLVRLYTDVTEASTAEMVTVFQKYHDTVMALGLRHRSRNYRTFDAADFSIGVDVFHKRLDSFGSNTLPKSSNNHTINLSTHSLLTEELRFISEISSHSCILNLNGTSSLSYVSVIIAIGRAALESVMSAGNFFIFGSISLSLLTFLCACSVSTAIPFIPPIGFVMYLLFFLPLMTFSMTLTCEDDDFMNRVPPKNDPSVNFITRDEGYRLYLHSFLRALTPAIAGQIVYLISFGELILAMDVPALVEANCINSSYIAQYNWMSVIRCQGLRDYSGTAKHIACLIMLSEMAFCITISSASFVFRTQLLWEEPPWTRNRTWLWCSLSCLLMIALFLFINVGVDGSRYIQDLPWYYFVLVLVSPCLSLIVCECIKRTDRYHENRAVRYRRLQFETRLGMWSPK